jgi:hypothetical protein
VSAPFLVLYALCYSNQHVGWPWIVTPSVNLPRLVRRPNFDCWDGWMWS